MRQKTQGKHTLNNAVSECLPYSHIYFNRTIIELTQRENKTEKIFFTKTPDCLIYQMKYLQIFSTRTKSSIHYFLYLDIYDESGLFQKTIILSTRATPYCYTHAENDY